MCLTVMGHVRAATGDAINVDNSASFVVWYIRDNDDSWVATAVTAWGDYLSKTNVFKIHQKHRILKFSKYFD